MKAKVRFSAPGPSVTLIAETPADKAALTKLRARLELGQRAIQGRGVKGRGWLMLYLKDTGRIAAGLDDKTWERLARKEVRP